jgi:hypothetical protein
MEPDQLRLSFGRATTAETVSPPPEAVVTQMIFGKWVGIALAVAAKLRVADALAAGPKAAATVCT